MTSQKIYHVSEDGNIEAFKPRPSPSKFPNINGNVVFGINNKLLHNYLLPRDCPRVTYYAGIKTTKQDKIKFLGQSTADFVIAIEAKWFSLIQQTTLYCYEFDEVYFSILDECAGYYISYKEVKPNTITKISDPIKELLKRNNVELRILPTLWNLADQVVTSSLNFSLIRMRNAIPKQE